MTTAARGNAAPALVSSATVAHGTHADRFAPLAAARVAAWGWSRPWQETVFSGLVGIVVDGVRALASVYDERGDPDS
jgi:hypothetical protein